MRSHGLFCHVHFFWYCCDRRHLVSSVVLPSCLRSNFAVTSMKFAFVWSIPCAFWEARFIGSSGVSWASQGLRVLWEHFCFVYTRACGRAVWYGEGNSR